MLSFWSGRLRTPTGQDKHMMDVTLTLSPQSIQIFCLRRLGTSASIKQKQTHRAILIVRAAHRLAAWPYLWNNIWGHQRLHTQVRHGHSKHKRLRNPSARANKERSLLALAPISLWRHQTHHCCEYRIACTHPHTHTQAHPPTYIHSDLHNPPHTFSLIYLHTHLRTHTNTRAYTYTWTHRHSHIQTLVFSECSASFCRVPQGDHATKNYGADYIRF